MPFGHTLRPDDLTPPVAAKKPFKSWAGVEASSASSVFKSSIFWQMADLSPPPCPSRPPQPNRSLRPDEPDDLSLFDTNHGLAVVE